MKPHIEIIPEGWFALATRRGKQFNSMVHAAKDAITGAEREAVLMHADDARGLGLGNGDPVLLRSNHGEYRGRVLVAPISRRNVQVHWPEGNILLDHWDRSPHSGVPDYNTLVQIEPAAGSGQNEDDVVRVRGP